MKIEFLSMRPKDDYDEIMTVRMIPRWYERLDILDKSAEETYAMFWGSGHQWWDCKTDMRADGWTSATLYDFWRDELNKRLERKNCKI